MHSRASDFPRAAGRPAKRRGFILLEALAGGVVVAVMVAVLLNQLAEGQRLTIMGGRDITAKQIAQRQAERTLALGYASAAAISSTQVLLANGLPAGFTFSVAVTTGTLTMFGTQTTPYKDCLISVAYKVGGINRTQTATVRLVMGAPHMINAAANPRVRRPHRGFTLLELLVGVTVGGFVVTAALQVYLTASTIAVESRIRGQLANEAAFAVQLLTQEIRMAGMGIPNGTDAATNAISVASSTLVANVDSFGFAADMPRPDGQYSTQGNISDVAGGTTAASIGIMFHNENNGNCAVKTSGTACNTGTTSMFFPGEDGCNDTADLTDRVCPWGLKRLRGAEPFLVVDGNGRWFNANNNATLTLFSNPLVSPASITNTLMLNIGTVGYPLGTWASLAAGDLPHAGFRVGYVSTPDRVFYRYVAGTTKTLERIQCWGTVDPAQAHWPTDATAALPGTPCASPFEGMSAFEKILGNVDAFRFTYFNAAGGTVSAGANTAILKRSIARVEFEMTLARKVFKTGGATRRLITHTSMGGVLMRMRRP